MTASTASIPILHSTEVVPFTHKSCYPSVTGLYGPHTPPTKEARQGNTTRPLQSSTSFRKPAIVSRKRNAGISHLTTIVAKSARELPYTDHSPTALALSGKVVLH